MRWFLKMLLSCEWKRHLTALHDSEDCVFCYMSLECQAHWAEDNGKRVDMARRLSQ